MITHNGGLTIKEIDDYYLSLRPDPTAERKAHEGVFNGCINLDGSYPYLGEDWVAQTIEQRLIGYYEFRQIGFATFQEFQRTLVRVWNENSGALAENLKQAQALTLIDEKEVIYEDAQTTAKGKSGGQNINKFTNTPNQYLAQGDGFNGLTTLSESDASNLAENSGTVKREVTRTKNHNLFEKWLDLIDKNKNIIYDFIKKFEWLFCHTYRIKNTI